jgi:hypothetical protein
MKYCPSLTPDRTTNIYNVMALGYKCIDSQLSVTHACYGSELGTSKLMSMRIANSIQDPQVEMTIDPCHAAQRPLRPCFQWARSAIGGESGDGICA